MQRPPFRDSIRVSAAQLTLFAPMLSAAAFAAIAFLYGYIAFPAYWKSGFPLGATSGELIWGAASAIVTAAALSTAALALFTVPKSDIEKALIGAVAIIAALAVLRLDVGGGVAGQLMAATHSNCVYAVSGFNNALAAFTIVSVMGACCVLAQRSWAASDLASLARSRRQYQLLLWVSSIYLFLAIFDVSVLYQWAADRAKHDGVADVHSAARDLTVGFGLIVSALACSMFVPVAIVQNVRLEALLQLGPGTKSRKLLLEEVGLEDIGPIQYFARQLPLIAPALASLIPQVFQR